MNMSRQGKYVRQRPKRRRKIFMPILVIVVLLVTLAAGGTIAKYLQRMETDYQQADASKFFFTSDLLGEDEQNVATYSQVAAGWDNASINFQLRNFQDSLNYSGVDVDYTVFYMVSGSMTDYEELTARNGTITKDDANAADISVSMTDLGISSGSSATVYIRVDAAPYTKSLYGCFEITIAAESGLTCTTADSAGVNACTVTVTTAKAGGTVYITYPSGCRYDDTDPRLEAVGSNVVSFTANDMASYSFVFFKTEPSENYSSSGFSASYSN